MNVTENNVLIAEFMGWKKSILSKTYERYTDGTWDSLEMLLPDEFEYHSDWNWLMEVVEKIKPLVFAFDICKFGCIVVRFKENDKLPSISFNNRDVPQIESVYKACVEFIKWRNTQNKK